MSDTGSVVLWLILAAALAATAWRSYQRARPLLTAPAASRFDHPGQRLAGVLRAVGLHERLLQRPYAGILHGLIFVSFFVLATSIVQAFGSGLFPGFTLAPVGGETWIGLLQDIFALLMLTGVGLAVWQRFVIRPARFAGSNRLDATIIYILIVAIVGSMLLEAAFAIADGTDGSWRPVARTIAGALAPLDLGASGLQLGEQAFYWLHIAAILTFLVYIPGSKHRHMFLAAPNIYLRNLQPKGRAPDVPADRTTAGIQSIDQFDWKQKLDLLSCTECGRCQAACPAYAAGLPLSPKLLITDLRDHMMAPAQDSPSLIGGVIREETLWACTTCRACMEVCPIHIEHLPKIIDMRRQMIDDGKVQPMLQEALSNLQRSGNSMGKAGRMRARWTKDLPFKIKDARKEPVDILWFVGDYASYDPRVQEITRKVATLLESAGVDFGLLFDAEQNSGNDVRRVGEEGLFETLARSNIDAIESCSFNRIMTTDPHSLNALRNEYLAYGKSFPVLHHTELLAELLQAGRLTIEPHQAEKTVTYHDPCYLGRYNGGFDAPRDLIRAAGFRLHDMPRCRENSFCCGAGGGRIWSDDTGVTERPSENRIKEAMALGDAGIFVVACPKDKVMYTAAVQSLGVEDRLTVMDIAELLRPKAAALPAEPAPGTAVPLFA